MACLSCLRFASCSVLIVVFVFRFFVVVVKFLFVCCCLFSCLFSFIIFFRFNVVVVVLFSNASFLFSDLTSFSASLSSFFHIFIAACAFGKFLSMLFFFSNASLIFGWFFSSFILLFLFLEFFFSDLGVPCFILELVELGLLRGEGAGGGRVCTDGPAGGASGADAGNRHRAAGGDGELVVVHAEGVVGCDACSADWAGGEHLDAGATGASASRPIVTEGGSGALGPTEGVGGDVGPTAAGTSRPIAAGATGADVAGVVLEPTEPADRAGGEQLDAGVTRACASRPIAPECGNGALEPTEGVDGVVGPTAAGASRPVAAGATGARGGCVLEPTGVACGCAGPTDAGASRPIAVRGEGGRVLPDVVSGVAVLASWVGGEQFDAGAAGTCTS